MKLNIYSIGFLSISALLPFTPLTITSASAVCVVADVNTQVVVRGSKTPSKQTNEVDIIDDQPCFGNTSVNVNRQIAVTPGEAEQHRTSRHQLGQGTSPLPGFSGKTVRVPVNVQIDQYNPALDPQFLESVNRPDFLR